jgi:hypothetical protein
MAISVVFDFPNGSVERYHKVFERGGQPILDQPARLHHQCFAKGDGIQVVDIWEDEESFGKTYVEIGADIFIELPGHEAGSPQSARSDCGLFRAPELEGPAASA